MRTSRRSKLVGFAFGCCGVLLAQGCDPAPLTDTADAAAAPQTLGSLEVAPESLTAQAAYVRGSGGTVALVETVAFVENTDGSTRPTGMEGVNLRTPEAVFRVRVLDGLGGPWRAEDEMTIRTAVGEDEVVDDAGALRTDWAVSGVGNALWMRGLPSTGSYVAFVFPGAPASVYFVATYDGALVSGEKTRSGESLPLDALRH